MKKLLFFFFSFLAFQLEAQTSKLWYREPAVITEPSVGNGWKNDPEWLKALPVGNGFIGAMVFGGVNRERIHLNEKSLWSGSPQNSDNPEAGKHLKEIRSLLFAGKYKEATALANKTQIPLGKGSGNGNGANVPFGCYQTLGDLQLDFGTQLPYTNYSRELDLINGLAITRFHINGIKYTREVFASFPDKTLVIRLTANKHNSLSFCLSLDRPERFKTVAENNELIMRGTLSNGIGGDGMQYEAHAIPVLEGGSLKAEEQKLYVKEATAVTIFVTAATNYRLHYPDYKQTGFDLALIKHTKQVSARKYAELRKAHVADFSSYMKRSVLVLADSQSVKLPTNEWLNKNEKTRNEKGLYALYYQYGRYLLLSSSRQGSLPANLQGIWANQIQTPWNGDYHTDINVQMNYWPAEITNLAETHPQLNNLTKSLVQPGSKTAKIQYNMNGWLVHPITNVWGYTSPGEHPSWGMHVGAAAWISQHLWEHYTFSLNKEYLRTVWPTLKGACLFYLDWLTADPKTGKLISGPAASPENTFIAPDGSRAQMSMGPSHDQEVIYDLFSHTLEAAKSLSIKDDAFVANLKAKTAQLARPKIGSDGRLMEWAEEFKEVEPAHRHVSHLFALYPGNEISFYKTPELANAARKSLEARGDGANGWSLAWKMAFWARLHDGDHSLKLLNNLLRPTSTDDSGNNGGSYYNLFDACPPFQIDGNFGATAAIAEMLVQSHEGFIELLPALPKSWKNGSITGLRARGNAVIDLEWKNSKLVKAVLTSGKSRIYGVKYGVKTISLNTIAGHRYLLTDLIAR